MMIDCLILYKVDIMYRIMVVEFCHGTIDGDLRDATLTAIDSKVLQMLT